MDFQSSQLRQAWDEYRIRQDYLAGKVHPSRRGVAGITEGAWEEYDCCAALAESFRAQRTPETVRALDRHWATADHVARVYGLDEEHTRRFRVGLSRAR